MSDSAELDELYRDTLLEHYHNPRNAGPVESPTHHGEAMNPFCGDEVHLALSIKDGVVEDLSVSGVGCSISQASASLMGTRVKGAPITEIREVAERFRAMMMGAGPETGSDLDVLKRVRKYPVRIKCALLAWTALDEALGD